MLDTAEKKLASSLFSLKKTKNVLSLHLMTEGHAALAAQHAMPSPKGQLHWSLGASTVKLVYCSRLRNVLPIAGGSSIHVICHLGVEGGAVSSNGRMIHAGPQILALKLTRSFNIKTTWAT
jgi:hypothetical protein